MKGKIRYIFIRRKGALAEMQSLGIVPSLVLPLQLSSNNTMKMKELNLENIKTNKWNN